VVGYFPPFLLHGAGHGFPFFPLWAAVLPFGGFGSPAVLSAVLIKITAGFPQAFPLWVVVLVSFFFPPVTQSRTPLRTLESCWFFLSKCGLVGYLPAEIPPPGLRLPPRSFARTRRSSTPNFSLLVSIVLVSKTTFLFPKSGFLFPGPVFAS